MLTQALIPKLKELDSNPGIVTSILAAIGELAGVLVLKDLVMQTSCSLACCLGEWSGYEVIC